MINSENISTWYEKCQICPRQCFANRNMKKTGFCGVTDEIKIARAALHMWEEPCISGKEGSGAVFFSGCSLGCIFCQNRDISKGQKGKIVTQERLADIFLELEEKGANNINLVTAGHYLPSIVNAVILAKNRGLKIPFVYNSSGYEKVESLKLLDGLIDIYLPDYKYSDERIAKEYSFAPDYSKVAKSAIAEMVRQVPEVSFDERDIMKKGVIVRHLLLPGHVKNSKAAIKYLYETYKDQIFISIMSQYTPMKEMEHHAKLGRKVTKREYEKLIDYALELGITDGFIQEGDTVGESFIPDFNGEGVDR